MRLDFTKMQSLGNDFVVLDGVSSSITITADLSRQLADRHFGIGCDQILLAEKDSSADFRFRIFNQDGSEVAQCGNGARCFAIFLRERGLTSKNRISVQTLNRHMTLHILDNGDVRVEIGVPIFTPAKIPFRADSEAITYPLNAGKENVTISALAVGNPHAVIVVDNVDSAPVEDLGPVIESHPDFPERVNAGFMQIVSPQHIRLRVFERGVGETLGCGSGACAAVVSGIRLGLLRSPVRVSLPGGDATVEWGGDERAVFLSGPAHHVFTGEIELPDIVADGLASAVAV